MMQDRAAEVLRFCIVGGVSFVVDYSLLYMCTEFAGITYLYSSAIAFTTSVIINYWLCLIFVFKNKQKQSSRQKALFIGSSIVGLGLNQLCMYGFVEILGIYYLVAKIMATAIVTIWNYVMKRKAVMG